MKKAIQALLIAVPALLLGACESCPLAGDSSAECGECGEAKGGDECCVAEAETCESCGEIKGSEDCCK